MAYAEVTGSLFDAPTTSTIAHCVSQGLKMGAGIAREFIARYGERMRTEILTNARQHPLPNNPEKTRRQGVVGEAIRTPQKDFVVYNLITKEHYYGKPNYVCVNVCRCGHGNTNAYVR